MTFDSASFTFPGTCSYTLAEVCDKSDPTLTQFAVVIGSEGGTAPKTVDILVNGNTYRVDTSGGFTVSIPRRTVVLLINVIIIIIVVVDIIVVAIIPTTMTTPTTTTIIIFIIAIVLIITIIILLKTCRAPHLKMSLISALQWQLENTRQGRIRETHIYIHLFFPFSCGVNSNNIIAGSLAFCDFSSPPDSQRD